MDEQILNIVESDKQPATSEEYEKVFGSEMGKRVLLDLAQRYNIGKPSFLFVNGQMDLEQSARADAAKVIITDIITRSKYKHSSSPVATGSKAQKAKRLPSAATQI